MTEFKKGDLVKVTRRFVSHEGPDRLTWVGGDMDKFIGQTCRVTAISSEGHVKLRHGFDEWYFYPFVLEHVNARPATRILFEKILVNGVKCRKITGFEGILQYDELPKKYVNGRPAFWLDSDCGGRHVFRDGRFCWEVSGDWRGNGIRGQLPHGVDVDVGHFGFAGIQEGSVWPETTYQELLTWLKRAGSRLAKIRREEREAWSGAGADEI